MRKFRDSYIDEEPLLPKDEKNRNLNSKKKRMILCGIISGIMVICVIAIVLAVTLSEKKIK